MFHFGNAKAVDLKHLLSSILNSALEQHFCFKIVLKRVKQKVATNTTQLTFWSSKCFRLAQNHSHQLKKNNLTASLSSCCKFFVCPISNTGTERGPPPKTFAQLQLYFFLPLKSESPSGLTLCFTLFVSTHTCSCVNCRAQQGFMVIPVHYGIISTNGSSTFLPLSKALSSLSLPGQQKDKRPLPWTAVVQDQACVVHAK